jgi:predicted nucleotidyltransferase
MTQPTNAALRKSIVNFFQLRMPELLALYLFGSEATGHATTQSDIDIAILLPHNIALSSIERFELAQELASQLNKDIDLIDLRLASTVLRSQIISTGTRLLNTTPNTVDIFETFVFSDYARLNEERAGILTDITQRNAVYG